MGSDWVLEDGYDSLGKLNSYFPKRLARKKFELVLGFRRPPEKKEGPQIMSLHAHFEQV